MEKTQNLYYLKSTWKSNKWTMYPGD
jgi:hypothetical protein